jgi:hypothetical protein
MAKFLQFALRNVNGLTQHTKELKTFISVHNIDVMLISEMRFTEKSYLKLPNYAVHHTYRPAGTARGGTAIIIKHTIKHHQLINYSQLFLQVDSGRLSRSLNNIGCLASIQTHNKQEQLEDFLQYPRALVHCRRRLQC